MGKGILIIDIPNSCNKCPLFGDVCNGMYCSELNKKTIDYPYLKDFRQKWCPIRPLPERAESFAPEEMCDIEDWYDAGYADGWNACMNKITAKNLEGEL